MGSYPTGRVWRQWREVAQAEPDKVRMYLGSVCSGVADELAIAGVREQLWQTW
jgi:hypothetical protein